MCVCVCLCPVTISTQAHSRTHMRGWRVRSRSAWGTSAPLSPWPLPVCGAYPWRPGPVTVTHVLGLRGNAGDVHSDSAPRARHSSSVHQSGAPARDVPGTVHGPSRYGAGPAGGPGGGRHESTTPGTCPGPLRSCGPSMRSHPSRRHDDAVCAAG